LSDGSTAIGLRAQLLEARSGDGGWGYQARRASRLEPTCWALLALRSSQSLYDSLAGWPTREGALLEHRDGLPNWSFHALALTTRLALGAAPASQVLPLAHALVLARGLALDPSPVQRQDSRLQGWSWVPDTFSWVEPTAWALLALKQCHARGMAVKNAEARILDGERLLRDRVCANGGWNYGNSNVFDKNLPSYVPATAIVLLALQDLGDDNLVRAGLDYLEEHAQEHPSTRALALSVLALRRHGRPAAAIETTLCAWLDDHPPSDVVSSAMAVCALEPATDDAFVC
jgi:hypothetical protein